jgi:hypothetical protein
MALTFRSKKLALICFIIGFIIVSFVFFASSKIAQQTQQKNPQPKKVMFIVHTETSGGKGVYDLYQEMKQVGHDVKIVAIPYIINKDQLAHDLDINFVNKFDQNDVIYPCGKKRPYTKCENIDQYKPDYIFTQNPYNNFKGSVLDPYFMNESLHKMTKKLAYVIYGPYLFHQHTLNDKNLSNVIDIVFVDSEVAKDIYKQYFNFPENRIVVSGYPTYKSIRDLVKIGKAHRGETILWLPRWLLSFEFRDKYECGSTFLNYHYFFYNYAKNNPHINFIIRPHGLLFIDSVAKNHLSQNDLDEIFEKFRSLSNVKVSIHTTRPLVDDIMASDIVIADGTSALGEVVVADKPIIYLSNGWNNEFNSNKLSKALEKYVYIAYNPNDIIKYLNSIKTDAYKPFIKNTLLKIKSIASDDICTRDDFKKMLDPIENPAKYIAEYLLYN